LRIDELAPRIEALLGTQWRRPEVRIAKGLLAEIIAAGCCTSDRILLDEKAEFAERQVIVHELVHWAAVGCWDQLSEQLEEGLADRLAAELEPENASVFLLARFWNALEDLAKHAPGPDPERLLETARPGSGGGIGPTTPWGNAVAYVLVSRIGVARLRELCAASAAAGQQVLPLSEVLAAAGLERIDTQAMRAQVLALERETARQLTWSGRVPRAGEPPAAARFIVPTLHD
jgi:hypothetical protein